MWSVVYKFGGPQSTVGRSQDHDGHDPRYLDVYGSQFRESVQKDAGHSCARLIGFLRSNEIIRVEGRYLVPRVRDSLHHLFCVKLRLPDL